MLIFHKFPTFEQAESFRIFVTQEYELDGYTYTDTDKAQAVDPIPVELVPPVVHIVRPYDDDPVVEHEVERLAPNFGGVFAGT